MRKIKLTPIIAAGAIILSSASCNEFTPWFSTNITAYSEDENYYEPFGFDKISSSHKLNVGEITEIKTIGSGEGYIAGDPTIKFLIKDEELAKIVKVEGKSVYVEGIVSGITQLIAETPDNQKFFFWISVSDVGLHFVNSRGIVPVNIGESASTILVGYEFENKSYQIGESPVKYTIDDENIAEIINFEGDDINIRGISVGETTLRAETPEGETAEIKIVVSELVETTTIPIETTPIYNSTTTVDLCGGDIYTSHIIGDANSDFKVSISDSVKILQNIANSEKYTLTEQEKINADCYDPGSGITGLDAAAIQKFDAGIIDKLPETLS